MGTALVACDDENDPKTWVKRLDDPAQRANAIKRLTQFYEDGMTKASNNASAPEIKALLDTIVEPMAKTYTAGGLDEKTRIDLMKFLAETHDPRTQTAIAKSLKDFEMGKTDDETRVACDSINAMSKAGVKLDQTVIDELWNVFARFQLSKVTSERLYHAVQDAVLQVKDPSYADKAIEKLKATVPPNPSVDVQKDQLMWWQLTSVRILSELQYAKAVKPLIVALLTPAKTSTLGATIQFALLKLAKVSEPELIKALNQSATPTTPTPSSCGSTTRAGSASSPRCSRSSGALRGATPSWPHCPPSRQRHGTHRAGASPHADAWRPPLRAGVSRRVQEALVGRQRRPARRAEAAHRARPAIGEVLRSQAGRMAAKGDEGGP